MHSKLSFASVDSERSSVIIPAERSADSSLGRIPSSEDQREFRAAAISIEEHTSVRLSVVW